MEAACFIDGARFMDWLCGTSAGRLLLASLLREGLSCAGLVPALTTTTESRRPLGS